MLRLEQPQQPEPGRTSPGVVGLLAPRAAHPAESPPTANCSILVPNVIWFSKQGLRSQDEGMFVLHVEQAARIPSAHGIASEETISNARRLNASITSIHIDYLIFAIEWVAAFRESSSHFLCAPLRP